MTRVLLIICVARLTQAAVTADDTVNYQTQVRHVLQQRCFACHGVLKQESSLRLDTAASAIRGGDGGVQDGARVGDAMKTCRNCGWGGPASDFRVGSYCDDCLRAFVKGVGASVAAVAVAALWQWVWR